MSAEPPEHTELGAVLAEATLMRLARTRPLTIDDLPEQDDLGRTELIVGSLYVTPLGDLEHQRSSSTWSRPCVQPFPTV